MLMSSKKGIRTVTPAEAGVQDCVFYLDSGPFDKLRVPSLSRDFRRNDTKCNLLTFYRVVNAGSTEKRPLRAPNIPSFQYFIIPR